MVDIYIKFYFRLENFRLDYNFWNMYNWSGPPALIVKRVQLQSNQKLLHQYLHSKNSSISKFIPKIQQKSHGHLGIALGIFGHVHPKNQSQLLVSWFCTSTQKISLFYLLIFEIQWILENCDQTDHGHT